MTQTTNTAVASLTLPAATLSRVMKAAMLSCEQSQGEHSFLSAIAWDFRDTEVELSSQSSMSTLSALFIHSHSCAVAGEGVFLVKVSDLSSRVAQLPQDGDIIVEFFDDHVTLSSHPSRRVKFSCPTMTVISEDFIPHAPSDIPKSATIATCSGGELAKSYARGASSALAMDKESVSGQSPQSGALVTISENAIDIVSFSHRGSHAHVDAQNVVLAKKTQSLTSPALMPQRLAVFGGDDIQLGIDEHGAVYVADSVLCMRIMPLATGAQGTTINDKAVFSVLGAVWGNRRAVVNVSAQSFFAAITRCVSVHPASSTIIIDYADVTITGSNEQGLELFYENITADVSWDGAPGTVTLKVDAEALKALSKFVPSAHSMSIAVCMAGDNTPGAIAVYDKENFNADNPQDFFILPLISAT